MMEIRRRRLLAAISGAAGTTVLAGCLSGPFDPSTGTGGDGEPGSPGPERATECPDYDRVQEVICYDGVDPERADVFLEPSDRAVGPSEAIAFSLRNRSERTLQTNFYNWNVHKRVDGEWYHVAPRGWNDPLMSVPTGEQHTWTVTFDNDGIVEGKPVPRSGGTEDVAVAGVDGGHYAFRGRGWFEGDSHESAVAFAATFELDAEPMELTTTNAVGETEWEDETLVARSTRGDPNDEDYLLGAYVLERIEAPTPKPRRLILEQVVRNDRLRDVLALALEREADRVRLEEYDGTVPIFGRNSERTFEFQGSYYEVRTRELEDRT